MARMAWRWLCGVWLSAMPLACADLLGLEPGVLADDATTAGSGALPAQGGDDTAPSGGIGNQPGGAGGSGVAPQGGSAPEPSDGGVGQGGGPVGAEAGQGPGSAGQGPCSAGSCTTCPLDMVQGASSDDYPFCIDVAEVTNQQYLTFTEQHTAEGVAASAACAGNTTFEPDEACGGALHDVPSRKLPVVCVDFCDAEAYCSAHGKRLCGRVGGTMNTPGDDADASTSEWYAACAGPEERIYSTGDAQTSSQCNGSGYTADSSPRDVEEMSACEGGLAGLYNMSGNVAEWTWSCSSTSAGANCSTRGGSFVDGGYELRCAAGIGQSRFSAADNLGFRCCADLEQ